MRLSKPGQGRPLLRLFLPGGRRFAVAREPGYLAALDAHAHVRRNLEHYYLVTYFVDSAQQAAGRHHLVIALEFREHLALLARLGSLRAQKKPVKGNDQERERHSRPVQELFDKSLLTAGGWRSGTLCPRDSFKKHRLFFYP